MPQPPSQMPFGAGYLPQQQNMQMPQPMGNYGAPQPPMSNYGQVPQMNPYMQQPPMGNYGAQQPPIPSYGQQPAMGSYGQAPQMSNYGQDPSPAYPQTSQPMYPSISSAQNAFPQSAPNYSSPTAPSQNYGSYGAPSAQHQPIQAQQYASSYSSAPTPQVRRVSIMGISLKLSLEKYKRGIFFLIYDVGYQTETPKAESYYVF